jgi:uncharacterized protein YqeY
VKFLDIKKKENNIMTLEILQEEMIAAMKAKKKIRKDTISSLIGAVKKAAIDEMCKDNITEELVNRVILKEKKTMQEMIDTCPADREYTLAEYKQKFDIINEFVPQMMSEEEIRKAVYTIISSTDIQQIGKGAIMKAVMPKLKGKADGKLINKVVSEIVEKSGE